MCDLTAMMVIGTVVSAGSSIASGMQTASQYEKQALATERQAELEGEQGEYEATQLEKQNQHTIASTNAAFSAEGVKVSDTVMRITAEELALNVEAVRFGTEINQENLATQAEIQRSTGSNALIGGFVDAATTLIGSPLGQQGFKTSTSATV